MKFLSEKTVLKFLGLPKIESSIVISDPFQKDCPMVFISKEFSKHTGYSIKEAIGKNCRFLQGPETDMNDVEHIRRAIKMKKSITKVFVELPKNDRSTY